MLMKRTLENAEQPIFLPASQAAVEQACCTAVAVMACAGHLLSSDDDDRDPERWIRQGCAISSSHAKDVIDVVSTALPICCGDEVKGPLGDAATALSRLSRTSSAAVLTIGDDYCMAIFGGCKELFDSHPIYEGKYAARVQFPRGREQLVQYLQERFPGDTPFHLCTIKKRSTIKPRVFETKEAAFRAADVLPPGFLHVFSCKEDSFLVAGFEDFRVYSSSSSASQVIRKGRPMSFYAVLELERIQENRGDPDEMLELFLQAVKEEHGKDEPSLPFHVFKRTIEFHEKEEDDDDDEYDDDDGGMASMSQSQEDDDEEEEDDEEEDEEEDDDLDKVSFHVHNHSMWFSDEMELQAFMERVERRCRHIKVLQVWRMEADNKVFFADTSIYTRQDSLLLPFSGKHPFVPVNQEELFDALVCPPTATLYAMLKEKPVVQQQVFQGWRAELAAAIQAHYKVERVLSVELDDACLVHITTTTAESPIVVVDLKRRVFYESEQQENEHPLPCSVSLVDESQLEERGVFPAGCSSARTILAFAAAMYKSGKTGHCIPLDVDVRYDGKQYEATLADKCHVDRSTLVLQVTQSKLVVRCKGRTCKTQGKRWERPSHAATGGSWDLSFLFPQKQSKKKKSSSSVERFLAEPNFYLALGLNPACSTRNERAERLSVLQEEVEEEEGDPRVLQKANVISRILLNDEMEVCYRECLVLASDYAYPPTLIPRGPVTLAIVLCLHLAKRHGYKRVESVFYVPSEAEDGRVIHYEAVPMKSLLTRICTFDKTPNLCAGVMWNKRVCEDLYHVLGDENHFASLPISKRYLGYTNVVYDLEENVVLSWEDVRRNPHATIPFNYLKQTFPVDILEQAKARCPEISVCNGEVVFSANHESVISLPLFDQTIRDQAFPPSVAMWLFIMMGRMFHNVGKVNGDNWEIIPYLIGAPGTFKSSIIAILKSYLQHDQMGVLATKVEAQYPLASLQGKLMVFMSECGGCTLERDLLKEMASGDPVAVTVKHKTATNVSHWDIPCMFAGNSFLNLQDTDGSVMRKSVVFPFTHILAEGQGKMGLVDDIIAKEGPELLIKCNTLYLAARRSLLQTIQPLLPRLLKDATRQAIMAHDSLLSFLEQQCIVTEKDADVYPWSSLWKSYLDWCRSAGKKPYSADPFSVEVQTLLARMHVRRHQGGSLDGSLSLMGIRAQGSSDVPFQSIFEVRYIQRGRK